MANPVEMENLSRLLSGSNFSNVRLGLKILEEQPEYIKNQLNPLAVLRNFLNGRSKEEANLIKTATHLILQHLSEKEIKEIDKRFYPFTRRHSAINWLDYEKYVNVYKAHAKEYEPFILGNANYMKVYSEFIECLVEQYEQPVLAYGFMQKLIEREPKDDDSWVVYVDLMINYLFYEGLYITENEVKRVIRYLNKLVDAIPGFNYLYYNLLGITYELYADDLEKAKHYYRKVLEISPDHDGAMNNLAVILYSKEEDFEGAYKLAKKAYEIAPEDEHNIDTYACVLFYGYQKIALAEELLRQIQEITNGHDHSMTVLGELLEQKGELNEAQQWYLKGLEISPNDEYKLLKYAQFLQHKMKNDSEALVQYKKLLSLNKGHAEAIEMSEQILKERLNR